MSFKKMVILLIKFSYGPFKRVVNDVDDADEDDDDQQ
jgi:hypothetical protein